MADRVRDNFVWRIEAVTPTETGIAGAQLFREIDYVLGYEDASPVARTFDVTWAGSGEDFEPTDIRERWADHEYLVEVVYPADLPPRQLHALVKSDRHDLIKTLRDTDGYAGYNDANSDTDIGVCRRVRARDRLIPRDTHWLMQQTWVVTLRESEQ